MKKDGKYYSPINGEELSLGSDGLLHSPSTGMTFMIDRRDNIIPLSTTHGSALFKTDNGLFSSELKDEQYRVSEEGKIIPIKDPINGGNLKSNGNGTYRSETTGLNFMYDEKKQAMVPLYIPDETNEPAHIVNGELVGEKSGRRYKINERGEVSVEDAQEFQHLKDIKEELPEEKAIDSLEQKESNNISGDGIEEILSGVAKKIELSDKKGKEDSLDVSILGNDTNISSIPSFDLNLNETTVNEFGEIVRNPIDPYGEYRENMARVFEEEKDKDIVLSSTYTVVNGNKCYHQLEKIVGDSRVVIQQQVFDYDQEFKDSMLEPSITDYAQRSPMAESKVIESSEYKEVSHFQTFSTNNNMLSINNIETTYAHSINNAIQSIEPTLFKQGMGLKPKGPVLSKTPTVRGFINSLLLSIIIGFSCGFLSWLIVFFYHHQ